MKNRLTLFIALIGIAVLAGLAVTFLLPSSPPSQTALVLLDGRTLTLQSLRGRPVLVNFWATTCPPCIEELPDLAQLYRELQPQGLEIIAVSMAYDPPIVVQDFVKRYNLPYPVSLDLDGKIARAFGGVAYVPTSYILAPNGNIVLQYSGRLDVPKARRIIMKYLKTAA